MNLLQPLPTCSQLALHLAAKSVDHALARERDQLHVAGLAGLEAHRGAGGDIEPHAARLLAVELQRRIGLEEMVVRADLDRPVAGIGDRQRHRLAAGVELDFAVLDEEFTGDHDWYLANVAPSWPGLSRPSTSCFLIQERRGCPAQGRA